jgi:hypothetical protein
VGEEGDSDIDLGIGMRDSPELLISELIRGVQDNAGKTTLLYRLKVRPLVYHNIII